MEELASFLTSQSEIEASLLELLTAHRKSNIRTVNLFSEYYNAKAEGAETNYFFLVYKSKIVFITRAFLYPTTCLLGMIITRVEFQNKGLCQNGVKKVMKLVNKKSGISHFELYVKRENSPAIQCYQKIGFSEVEVLRTDGYVIMTKYLPNKN